MSVLARLVRIVRPLLVVLLAGGAALAIYECVASAAAPVTASAAPRIEEVREIAKLAVLRVQVSDVIEGRNAGGRALVLVHGDADLAIDWGLIEVAAVDTEQRTLTLSIPVPQVERARVDHDRTRVYEVVKTGLAAWNPLADPRPMLLENAMQAAQQSVERLARDPSFVEQARLHAETLLAAYHQRLGWRTAVQWRAAPPTGECARPIKPLVTETASRHGGPGT
jgi:hypothetical protein